MKSVLLWSALAFITTLAGSYVLLIRREWAKHNIWRILALVSGILLGVSFIHILPEAHDLAPGYAAAGAVTAFLLIFTIENFTMMHACAEFAEDCHVHMVSQAALAALSLHAVIDGIAIAIAFQKNSVLGQTVAGAILFHKFTDGLTLTGLLLGTNQPREKYWWTILILALATPLGTLVFHPFAAGLSAAVMGAALGFVAGTFLYVGAADILPRLHKARDLYSWASFAVGLVIGGIRLH